jgi:hypothetical protein
MEPLIVLLMLVLVIRWLMLRGRFSDLERQINELASAQDKDVSLRANLVQRVFALEQERKKNTAVPEQTPARVAVAKELVRDALAPVAPAAEITPLSIASAEIAPAPPVEPPAATLGAAPWLEPLATPDIQAAQAPPVEVPFRTVTASLPTSDVVSHVVPPSETPAFRAAAVEAAPVQPVETPEIAQPEPEIAAAVAEASEAPPPVVTPVPPAPEIRVFRAPAIETARVQPLEAPAPGPVTPPPEPVVAVLSAPPSAPVREPEDVGPTGVPDDTWAHSIDDASSDANPATVPPGRSAGSVERGSSDYDIRQTFSAAVSYSIPAPASGVWKAMFGNWWTDLIVYARTAPPVNVVSGQDPFGNFLSGASSVQRPNLVSGAPLWIADPNVADGKRINKAAFATPTGAVQGNLGRNTLRGFGATQVDLTLRRQFKLRERLALQARADLFNIFNHPNFGPPINYLISPLFGQSTQMLGASLGSGGQNGGLNPLYQIGGPRSAQLALKLLF